MSFEHIIIIKYSVAKICYRYDWVMFPITTDVSRYLKSIDIEFIEVITLLDVIML